MRHLCILSIVVVLLGGCTDEANPVGTAEENSADMSEANTLGKNGATAGSMPGSVTNSSAHLGAIYELQSAFHGAIRNSDAEAFGSLWTDDATLQAGGSTFSGPSEIVEFIQSAAPFVNGWASLASTYKTQIEIHGHRADYAFECIEVEEVEETGNLVGNEVLAHLNGTGTMRKVGNRWLFETFQSGVGPLP